MLAALAVRAAGAVPAAGLSATGPAVNTAVTTISAIGFIISPLSLSAGPRGSRYAGVSLRSHSECFPGSARGPALQRSARAVLSARAPAPGPGAASRAADHHPRVNRVEGACWTEVLSPTPRTVRPFSRRVFRARRT